MTQQPLTSTIAARLRRLGIAIVYLYGSEALGRSNRLSDIDVGVVLRNPTALQDRGRRARLQSTMRRLLEPVLAPGMSRELDLVLLQTTSPILQFEAIRTEQVLFVEDPIFQADYEAQVMRDYRDVRPLVEAHYQAALERAS